MSYSDVLTQLIPIVAILISLVSLIRTRKVENEQLRQGNEQVRLAEEQLRLERINAELSSRQIKNMDDQEQLKNKPQLNVKIAKIDGNNYFLISNTGQGSAYQVNLELLDCPNSPLELAGGVGRLLPYEELKPKADPIKLYGVFNVNTPLKYQVKLLWKDFSGKEQSETHTVSRP